jgi:hypothetical protein
MGAADFLKDNKKIAIIVVLILVLIIYLKFWSKSRSIEKALNKKGG